MALVGFYVLFSFGGGGGGGVVLKLKIENKKKNTEIYPRFLYY